MEQTDDLQSILDELTKPAFLVWDGAIRLLNTSARQHMLTPGMDIRELICVGQEEYSAFSSGCMYLTVAINAVQYRCAVTQLSHGQLFTLEGDSGGQKLQVLSLAAQQLNRPLTELLLRMDQLTQIPQAERGQLNRSFMQLQRILGNMADASQLVSCTPRMQTQELSSLIGEILEKAEAMLAHTHVRIACSLPREAIYGLANEELLRRGIYNMLSNAVKFTPAGGTVQVCLRRNGSRLQLSVTDGSQSKSTCPPATMFSRYTRQPGLEDTRFGLGLGMTILHAAAAAHGGTVLVQQEGQRTCVTMTMELRQPTDAVVRAPILTPDVYGGQDQAMIELSEVLPPELYQK